MELPVLEFEFSKKTLNWEVEKVAYIVPVQDGFGWKKKAKWGNQGFPSPLTYRLTSRYVLDPEETTLVQVGGWPTPLKNINIRQLGRFSISNMMGKSFKIHVPVTTKQISSSPYALFFVCHGVATFDRPIATWGSNRHFPNGHAKGDALESLMKTHSLDALQNI